MKTFIRTFAILLMLFVVSRVVIAQIKFNAKQVRQPITDSIYARFRNAVYLTYYNPVYMTNKKATSTFMKVDIDWEGKVTGLSFSDSADSTFKNAFMNSEPKNNCKQDLQNYVVAAKLTDISLLIPINYQPEYSSNKKNLTYNDIGDLLRFNKMPFKGKSIVFEAINIAVLGKGNM